jgi:hypothetical protein
MQTRRQAKQAAELAAAAQAVVQSSVPPPLPAHNATHEWAPLFASSLSELTPTSSFVSDAGTAEPAERNQSTISEAEAEDEFDFEEGQSHAAATARAFGVPQFFPRGGRSLRTPAQSQSSYYPPEVFETPRKNFRVPTEQERRAAQWARDSEIVKSGGLAQLTRNGTLLVPPESSLEPDHGRTGSGLGSAFTSPSSSRVWKRTTAAPSKNLTRQANRELQEAKTEEIDPETGVFLNRDH